MERFWYGTRRSAFAFAAAWLLDCFVSKSLCRASSSLLKGGVTRPSLNESPALRYRRYKVNATVKFLSVPLFVKANAGGAYIACEQASEAQGTMTVLQFGAGSWPHRVGGLNRFGMTRELVREEAGAVVESASYGFMTGASEKVFAEAKKSFTTSKKPLHLSVAYGRSTSAGCKAKSCQVEAPSDCSWSNCTQYAEEIFSQIQLGDLAVRNQTGPFPTFLFALDRALPSDSATATTYTHCGQLYTLRTEASIDSTSNQKVVKGRITPRTGGVGATDFTLWFRTDNPCELPARIEFHPRSFLTLSLEEDVHQDSPAIQPILTGEMADVATSFGYR